MVGGSNEGGGEKKRGGGGEKKPFKPCVFRVERSDSSSALEGKRERDSRRVVGGNQEKKSRDEMLHAIQRLIPEVV